MYMGYLKICHTVAKLWKMSPLSFFFSFVCVCVCLCMCVHVLMCVCVCVCVCKCVDTKVQVA